MSGSSWSLAFRPLKSVPGLEADRPVWPLWGAAPTA